MNCPGCENEVLEEYAYCPRCGYDLKSFFSDKDLLLARAKKLLDKKQNKEAITLLQMSCRLNNSQAMYEFGKLYLLGQVVPKNDKYVIGCMREAAKLNNVDAIIFLVEAYLFGNCGVKVNKETAYSYFCQLPNDAQKKYAHLVALFNKGDIIISSQQTNDNNADNIKPVDEQKKVPEAEPIIDEEDEDFNVGDIIWHSGNIETRDFINDKIIDTLIKDNKDPFEREKKQLDKFISVAKANINSLGDNVYDLKQEMNPEFTLNDEDYFNIRFKQDMTQRELERKETDYNNKLLIINSPYFSRIKYKEKGELKDIYVGREACNFGAFPVVSWTNEGIAAYVYNSDATKFDINGVGYDLMLKSKIAINHQQLQEVTDVFNYALGFKVVADEYLLNMLKQKKMSGRLSDIIETIQSHQFEIISSNYKDSFIMQGCAGCGKSMVLYHRIKYCLDNNHMNLNNVCVLTPNAGYNAFIMPLLKDLKIESIKKLSFVGFYVKVLSTYLKDDSKSTTIRQTVNKTPDDKERRKDIRWNLDELLRLGMVKIKEDSDLPKDIVEYYYSKEFMDQVFNAKRFKLFNELPYREQNPNQKHQRIVTQDDFRQGVDVMTLFSEDIDKYIPEYTREKNVLHKCELFALCLLYFRKFGEKIINQDSDGVVLRGGIKYLMIDEGQDLSLSEYVLINLITKTPTYNIFGDVNQVINNYGIKNWDSICGVLGNISQYKLKDNYRNTSQIVEYVNKECDMNMESAGVDGPKVSKLRIKDIKKYNKKHKGERISIICANSNKEKLKNAVPDARDYIFAVNEIKGQEFDVAYVVTEDMNESEKYIALTRPLTQLYVI